MRLGAKYMNWLNPCTQITDAVLLKLEKNNSTQYFKQTQYFTQNRGVCQGCHFSPALFDTYIYKWTCYSVGQLCCSRLLPLTVDIDVKSLFFADDLVLLSASEEGLQLQLDIRESPWGKSKKIYIMIFQKHSECQEGRYQFTINKAVIPHSMSCTYCRNNANSLREL